MVTHDEVRKIAALAKLYIAEDDIEAMTSDLNSVIEFADAVSQINVSASDTDSFEIKDAKLRKDVVADSYDRDLILKNAMEADNGCFVVRERGETR